jgi:hypothetical protein
MSLNRLRKLAGLLNESISDDPAINARIERQLNSEPLPEHAAWLDMLELLYNRGEKGVSRQELIRHMSELHGSDYETQRLASIEHMIDALPDKFHFVVRQVVGNRDPDQDVYMWHPNQNADPPDDEAESDDDDDQIDPATRGAIGAQVDITYTAMEAMREMTAQNGGFTEQDLANIIANRNHLPGGMARELANHVIGLFQAMLIKARDGRRWMVKPEVRNTRDTNMDLFRELEAKAKNAKDET